jgi:hypothetical protein
MSVYAHYMHGREVGAATTLTRAGSAAAHDRSVKR